MLHVHVLLVTPLGTGHMAKSGTDQHKGGVAVREAAYHAGTAADHCGADWNEQAAKSAKNYLDFTAFSRDELIAQLEYEGFTHEQAVYGAEANGY